MSVLKQQQELSDAEWRKVLQQWAVTDASWRDYAKTQFVHEHWEPLTEQMVRTKQALDLLIASIERAKRTL